MILNVLDDIWSKLTEFSNNSYNFIMNHFDDPIFWIAIVGIILVICYSAVSNLSNK